MEARPGVKEDEPPVRFANMRLPAACAVAAALSLATYWTLRLGYADRLFHTGAPGAVIRARELALGNAAYYSGSSGAPSALEKAVELNPRYSPGWIELGLAAELDGDLPKAERMLLEAFKADRTYEPRWTLANFYFRRGDRERFFYWAREAARMAYQNQTPLFLLCWRMSQDPETILDKAIPGRREIVAQYLYFLLLQKNLDAAGPVGERLAKQSATDGLPLILFYCDRLLEAGRTETAVRVWNTFCMRRVIPGQPLAPREGRSLTDGSFSGVPLAGGFGWSLQGGEGISFARAAGSPGLQVTFSGKQPENCRLVAQVVPLEPSRDYRLRYTYRTSGIRPGSGLRWDVGNLTGGKEWSVPAPDLASEEWTQGKLDFTTPPDAQAARLSLRYDRALGTTRIEGSVWLREVSLTFR
jgi:hypothetical protein